MNNTQHHVFGGWWALIALAGMALVKFIETHDALLSGIASICTALAAAVSILFTLIRKKSSE